MFLVSGMVLGTVVAAADVSSDFTVVRHDVARQKTLQICNEIVREAGKLMMDGDFDAAIKKYQQVVAKLDQPKTAELYAARIQFCREQIKRCYSLKAENAMKKADKSASVGDFENAIKLLREAIYYYPEMREELSKKIVFYEKRRDAAINREETSIEKLQPNLDAQEYQIQVLLEQGRALARRGDLIKSRRKFEEILLIDPFNDEANQNLLGVSTRIRKAAEDRANATSREYTGKVMWSAAIPVVQDSPGAVPENQLGEPVVKQEENPLEKKLKAIIIPSIDFEDKMVTFANAMQTLSDECRRRDPARRGVNFIIKDKPAPVAAPVPAANNPDGTAAPAAAAATPAEEPTLTAFSKKQVSVYDILTELQKRGDLTFKVGPNAVFVAAPGVLLEGMTVKIIPADLDPGTTKESLQEQLAAAGIPFDDKSYVMPMANHVVAYHTPENLKKIEAELQNITSTQQPMVQIMFKFLEVNQNDLDELAFNWQYARHNSHVNLGSSSNALLRHYAADGEDSFSGSSQTGNYEDAAYNFAWVDSKNSLLFSVYALDWADTSDVLYSPRVTTLSGQTAKIDMSEKHYYPDEWENIDDENNENFRIRVSSAQPSLEDEQDLGVKFEIEPNVTGRQIQAKVNIPIKQFYQWLIVDTRSYNDDTVDGEFIKKPIFTNRTINTNVTLKDGETVLIGSVTNDVIKSIHDKIPILGDIPLVGRLFQSRYSNSQKVCLMIFMTCRLVKPDGSALYPDDVVNHGVPTFPRNQ